MDIFWGRQTLGCHGIYCARLLSVLHQGMITLLVCLSNAILLFPKAGYMEYWQFHKTYSGTPQGGVAYTSYKVANMLVEFSTSIPRTQLRPGYGDGFLGAPLQTGCLPESPTSQPRGGRRGTSSTPTSPPPWRFASRLNRVVCSPACVVQAYEQVVPIRRRPTAPGADLRPGGGAPQTQRVGRRHGS